MSVRDEGSRLRSHAHRLRPPPVCVRAALAASQTGLTAIPSGRGTPATATATAFAAAALADPAAATAATATAIAAAF